MTAQNALALTAIEKHALTVAAHARLALEGKPSEALAVYIELKQAAELTKELRMEDFEDAGHASEDDAVFVVDMMHAIEYAANTLADFGKLMLNAAHAGLVEAAIDGSLDSDAGAWHLLSLAEDNLDKVTL